MDIHRFSGMNCCTCVLGVLGVLQTLDKRKLRSHCGMQGETSKPGPGSAKMRVGRRGNGSLESQETGMEEPLGVGSPS